MLTVSHHKEGTEQFIEARSVVYHGPFSSRQQSGGYFLEIVQDDKTFDVVGGHAYVMSESGATVGRYNLDKSSAGAGIIDPA